MRYFRIHQDKRTKPGLVMNGLFAKGLQNALEGDLSLLDNLTVMKANSYRGEGFAELLDRQVFMCREAIKEVFDLYVPDLEYKSFCIIDADDESLHAYYYAPVFKIVSAISPKSERPYSVKSIYLDKTTVEELDGLDVFCLREPNNYIFVSLPVAESLMRRNIPGILLTHIEMV